MSRTPALQRILIYSIDYAPDMVGIAKYTAELAQWHRQRGALVTVVTAYPYYPAWRVAPGYRAWAYRRERVAGVDLWRCPLWVPRRPRGWSRILHLLSFACSSLPLVLWCAVRHRPDLVLVNEPPLLCAPGALAAAWLGRGMAWLHVQDFEVDAAFGLGLLRPGRLGRLLYGVERRLMRRFDRVSTISARMAQRLADKGVDRDRIRYLPNWIDARFIRPQAPDRDYARHLGIEPGRKVFLYSGNLGRKQGVEILAETARRCAHRRDLVFLVCGEGVTRDALLDEARSLPNLLVRPLQPATHLDRLLGLAYAHLLPQRRDAEDLVLPSKLSAMCASARPVLTTANPGSQLHAWVGQFGIAVPAGDPAALADAVVYLADHPRAARAHGRAAREFALRHWEMQRVLSRVWPA